MLLNRFYVFMVIISFSVVVIFANKLSMLYDRIETTKSLEYKEDSLLNFTELTGKYGYQSEEHKVVTEDGYILTVFRIVSALGCREEKQKAPVVLMHGLLLSSDSWIDSGPSAGLAYLVANACYDIWVGNTRGNYNSRNHVHLNPNRDAAYWQFCVDEIGYYDLPALIDYVLDNTKADKVNYIGFSQGAGTFFIMCSERPEYCDKTELMIALSPSTRHLNTKSALFRYMTKTVFDLEEILFKFGNHEFLPRGDIVQKSSEFLCQISAMNEICEKLIYYFDSVEPSKNSSLTTETIKSLVRHFPAGTSVHNVAKYGKMLISHEFVKFDYGKIRNLELYGIETPPQFNLNAVTVPILVIYGKNDGIVDVSDVEWLVGKLPHVLETFMVSDPFWSHLDFTYSQNTNKLLFPKMLEYLSKDRFQLKTRPKLKRL